MSQASVDQYLGMMKEESGWADFDKADVFDEGVIIVRTLSYVAQLILGDWLFEYEPGQEIESY
ncbi:hypothetical protein [Aureibacillus halotolerans]|uniref:hypothetical protein n=1 Tax=Aureibacillus halotolerans TaxID=1508390 RepID=UPI001061A887|nr:hypothetical protein [Aureibacillus halotolerans]